jgi:hypothetical protein
VARAGLRVSADQGQIIPTASRVALTPVNFPNSARMAIASLIETGVARCAIFRKL